MRGWLFSFSFLCCSVSDLIAERVLQPSFKEGGFFWLGGTTMCMILLALVGWVGGTGNLEHMTVSG